MKDHSNFMSRGVTDYAMASLPNRSPGESREWENRKVTPILVFVARGEKENG